MRLMHRETIVLREPTVYCHDLVITYEESGPLLVIRIGNTMSHGLNMYSPWLIAFDRLLSPRYTRDIYLENAGTVARLCAELAIF